MLTKIKDFVLFSLFLNAVISLMFKYILCCPQTLHINLLKSFLKNLGVPIPQFKIDNDLSNNSCVNMWAGVVGLYPSERMFIRAGATTWLPAGKSFLFKCNKKVFPLLSLTHSRNTSTFII